MLATGLAWLGTRGNQRAMLLTVTEGTSVRNTTASLTRYQKTFIKLDFIVVIYMASDRDSLCMHCSLEISLSARSPRVHDQVLGERGYQWSTY